MKRVFADTFFWVAMALVTDQWHLPAIVARKKLGGVQIVTTDYVLVEFLTSLSGSGASIRQQAALSVEDMLADERLAVLPESRETFLEGLSLFKNRLDKGHSMTDCISMNVCKSLGISEVLTNDRHFEQEGFTVLISR